MSRLSQEEKEYLKYKIYSYRYDDPWISNKKIAELVDRSASTVNRYAKQAETEEVIINPELKTIFPDRKAALLLFEDKWKIFNLLQDYTNIKYLSVYQGDWNILAIYDGEMDFSHIPGYKQKILQGMRGKIFTPKVEYASWEKNLTEIEAVLLKKQDNESKLDFNIQYPEWDKEEWIMFYYFEFDVKRKFNALQNQYSISWKKFLEWKTSLTDYCTVVTRYYPEGQNSYDNLTICFTTDYEEYIVRLFSQFPTTSIFYIIGEYLTINIFIPHNSGYQKRIYKVISKLIKKNIISNYMDGHSICYYVQGKT